MTKPVTRLRSVSVPVADQERALAFYVDTLGCEVLRDLELGPGARWIEVLPPGSTVSIALLTPDSGLPIGVRFGTQSADAAHRSLTSSEAVVHTNVLRLDFAPPMFTFEDPDGNVLVLIEDEPRT